MYVWMIITLITITITTMMVVVEVMILLIFSSLSKDIDKPARKYSPGAFPQHRQGEGGRRRGKSQRSKANKLTKGKAARSNKERRESGRRGKKERKICCSKYFHKKISKAQGGEKN
jgi:hypothetical protein